ncbi:hypothetical protein EVAR_49920_1 [Eumeta japonica]|uniref:Uncharacterized protein n=1 Tax=Eumeta variegata TaxID=151549 RepID=A0A4C1Y1C6_EUMVA|nr:hypothetical protein EVAR_49920_1 [Eumeta japonica]
MSCLNQLACSFQIEYLLTNDGKHDKVNVENKVNGALLAIMNSKSVSKQDNFPLHNGVLIPTLVYGSESWVWRKKNESRIDMVEMRSLRNMCGVSLKDSCRNSDVGERCDL